MSSYNANDRWNLAGQLAFAPGDPLAMFSTLGLFVERGDGIFATALYIDSAERMSRRA
jgi:hypothetical protein